MTPEQIKQKMEEALEIIDKGAYLYSGEKEMMREMFLYAVDLLTREVITPLAEAVEKREEQLETLYGVIDSMKVGEIPTDFGELLKILEETAPEDDAVTLAREWQNPPQSSQSVCETCGDSGEVEIQQDNYNEPYKWVHCPDCKPKCKTCGDTGVVIIDSMPTPGSDIAGPIENPCPDCAKEDKPW
jgi:hypothetical protein